VAAEQSERIKLWGIVQGVGFRPYVAKTADRFNMKGHVLNTGGLVEIILTDTPERISSFMDFLIENKPAPAEIVHVKREIISHRHFDSFTIVQSGEGDDEIAMLPADLAICPDCLRELYTEGNPRFQHPFISCMLCGPRYTIIDRIPYDRNNTSMTDFPMCSSCSNEYANLTDRRYHAQTISCHDCGPQLIWQAREITSPAQDQPTDFTDIRKRNAAILDNAADVLRNGGIIAFKSVGGYNLIADPLNQNAVNKLREVKMRESKPFAVMFRSAEQIEEFCHAAPTEIRLLESSARPILLLERRKLSGNKYDELRKNRFIGSYLPSFAAQYMLLDRISPLIFTSANLSDMPMIKDEREMMSLMEANRHIDGMLYNDRKIRIRADDSVARVIDNQPQMIRRSKGYAPVPLHIDSAPDGTMIFAAGSQLKNSFALTKGSFAYMSQFFGDMDTVENQSLYEENVDRLAKLFRIKPDIAVCDKHPLYFTTKFAQAYAKKNDIPLIYVQHHHAHVASVMAENNVHGKIIGVSFDGTGYGTDGCIWGGEFFICGGASAYRIAHLKYVDMPGGDSSVKDAFRSALSYVHAFDNGYLYTASASTGDSLPDESVPCGTNTLTDDSISGCCREIAVDISDIISFGKERLLSSTKAALVMSALDNGINTVKSSSMGRLFDGVSALLGIKEYNDYEGQCAIMLEDAAAFAQKEPGQSRSCDLALSFHYRISDMIVEQCLKACRHFGTSQVALSGGTFQNKILMEDVLSKLRNHGFQPYYNISVSPNDGGIALGQAYIAAHSSCQ